MVIGLNIDFQSCRSRKMSISSQICEKVEAPRVTVVLSNPNYNDRFIFVSQVPGTLSPVWYSYLSLVITEVLCIYASLLIDSAIRNLKVQLFDPKLRRWIKTIMKNNKRAGNLTTEKRFIMIFM